MSDGVVPEKEKLRRAVAWLLEQDALTPARVEEASQRFDLSALDEQFLLDHFLAEGGDRGHAPEDGA